MGITASYLVDLAKRCAGTSDGGSEGALVQSRLPPRRSHDRILTNRVFARHWLMSETLTLLPIVSELKGKATPGVVWTPGVVT